MSIKRNIQMGLGALVLGLGISYATPAFAQEKPGRVEAESVECTSQEERDAKKGPAKPNCADLYYGKGQCFQETVADFVGATESTPGYCPGKTDSYKCYNTAGIKKFSDLLKKYDGNFEKLNNDLEAILVSVKDLRNVFDGTFDDLTMFAIAQMKYECSEEYNLVVGKMEVVNASKTARDAAEKSLTDYVATAAKGNSEKVKALKPYQVFTEDQKTAKPKLDKKEFDRRTKSFEEAERDYQAAVADLNATAQEVRERGCGVGYQAPESKTPVIPYFGVGYGRKSGAQWLEGEVQLEFPLTDRFGLALYLTGNLPVDGVNGETTSRKTTIEQILDGMATQTTENTTVLTPYGRFGVDAIFYALDWLSFYAGIGLEAGQRTDSQKITVNGETLPSSESTIYNKVDVNGGAKACVGPICVGVEYRLDQDGNSQGLVIIEGKIE